MAQNAAFQNARSLSLPVADGTVSGDPVLIGDALVGVALTDKGDGGNDAANASVDTGGAYDLEIVAGAAMAAGDEVFIDAGVLSDDDTGVHFGYLLEAIAGASTVTRPVKVGY